MKRTVEGKSFVISSTAMEAFVNVSTSHFANSYSGKEISDPPIACLAVGFVGADDKLRE